MMFEEHPIRLLHQDNQLFVDKHIAQPVHIHEIKKNFYLQNRFEVWFTWIQIIIFALFGLLLVTMSPLLMLDTIQAFLYEVSLWQLVETAILLGVYGFCLFLGYILIRAIAFLYSVVNSTRYSQLISEFVETAHTTTGTVIEIEMSGFSSSITYVYQDWEKRIRKSIYCTQQPIDLKLNSSVQVLYTTKLDAIL